VKTLSITASPLIRFYQVTSHTLPLDEMMEKLGFFEKIPESEQRHNALVRLKQELKRLGVSNFVSSIDVNMIVRKERSVSDVMVQLKLTHVLLESELGRLNQLDGKKLEKELVRIGVFDSIPEKERKAMARGDAIPSFVLKQLNLTGTVLQAAFDSIDNAVKSRERRAIKDNPRSPFKLASSLPIAPFWNAREDAYHGVTYATEMLQVICFGKKTPTDQVLAHCNQNRLWPGDIRYLLALVAEHPQLLSTEEEVGQRGVASSAEMDYGKPIVALGSTIRDRCPVFSRGVQGVTLSEGCTQGNCWPPKARFITVPKH